MRSIVRVQSISPRPQFNNFSRDTVPLSKTTFYQILDCISLKVFDSGSLKIFANPCKFASQLSPNFFLKMLFHFFGKMSLPQTVYFLNFKFLIQIDPAKCTRCPHSLQTIVNTYSQHSTRLLGWDEICLFFVVQ